MDIASRRRAGAALWALGLGAALAWSQLDGRRLEAPALGFSPPVLVAPLEAGRLLSLEVGLHARVRAADVVARVDPVLVQAERDLAAATMLAVREQAEIQRAAEERRFAESAAGSALAGADLAASIREDEALLATLAEQRAIEQDLASVGAAAGLDVNQVGWAMWVVQERLAASRAALSVAERAAVDAERRNAAAPGVAEWEVVAAVRAVDLVDARLHELELRAGADGQVTALFAGPGALVQPGVPVMEVRAVTTSEVVAWVPTSQQHQWTPGADVVAVRSSGERLDARVLSVAGTPQLLPLAIWPYPNEARFGVPVHLELVEGEVAPDEPVTIVL